MKLWRELVSAAIVGTDRQKFELSAPGSDDLSRLLNSLETDENEAALLKTAAVIGSYLRTGLGSVPDKQDLPEVAADETNALISRQSEQHLATMLAGNYPKVLPEFFSLMAESGRVLPPQYLPEILDSGNSKRDLRQFILPVLGVRGRWLAHHNEDWQWALIEENTVGVWENGPRNERISALEILCRQNPAAARELLDGSWQSESAKDRADFLEILRINLDKSDEEFLENVLKFDKSGDVRRVAFNLLLKITDSNLVKSLTERAVELFNFKPGGFLSKAKLEINFPQNFEKEEKSDVLNNLELYLNERDLGKKAVKLVKLLHSTPPKIWEEKFSAKKEEIIEAANQSEWKKALLTGLKSAAINFADEEWLAAILPYNEQNDYYYICNQIEQRWTDSQIENFIPSLLEGRLKNEIGLNFSTQLFYRLKNIWSDDFTLKYLNFLQRLLKESDLKQYSGLFNHTLTSGQFISAKYINRFEEKVFQDLLEKIGELPGKANMIEEFNAVIQFRREMHQSFQNEE